MPSLDEIPHKKPKLKSPPVRGPRGYAAYRNSSMKIGGLSRPQTPAAVQDVSSQLTRVRGHSNARIRRRGIPRAEMLSQHEQVVSELREEDVERGLTLKSPVKSIDENFPILNEGT